MLNAFELINEPAISISSTGLVIEIIVPQLAYSTQTSGYATIGSTCGMGPRRQPDQSSRETAFESFCLLTPRPHAGLPSRPSIRRESINFGAIA